MIGPNTRRRIMLVVVWTVGLTLSGCSAAPETGQPSGRKVVQECPVASDGGSQFPASSIHPGANDDSIRRWFSSYLTAAALQPVWCGNADTEVYRLLYLPSSQPAVVIELRQDAADWLNRPRWRLRTFRFEDPHTSSRVDSSKVVDTQAFSIAAADTADFFGELMDADFWKAEYWASAGSDDGIAMLLEGRKSGIYRPITRLNIDPKIFGTARSMMAMAKIRIPPELEDAITRLQRLPTVPSSH